jgi:hypothetical protein
MHDFFNQVLVAIALNRTMLWKYYDMHTCQNVSKGYSPRICLKANTEPDCSRILKRAPWLASYDEWAPKLLGNNLVLPHRNPEFWPDSWINQTVIAFKPMVWQNQKGQLSTHHPFLQTNFSGSILSRLYSETEDFLNGMLFRGIFSFHPDIFPPEYSRVEPEGTRTYALHSRHVDMDDDGSDVLEEKTCLNTLHHKFRGQPCTVYLMSDRKATLHKMSMYVEKIQNCTPVVVTHVTDHADGHYTEHGPFAGAGFFQDWLVASQARHGFIGHCYRSSSLLLRELIQYDRGVEALESGSYPQRNLPECCLTSEGGLA